MSNLKCRDHDIHTLYNTVHLVSNQTVDGPKDCHRIRSKSFFCDSVLCHDDTDSPVEFAWRFTGMRRRLIFSNASEIWCMKKEHNHFIFETGSFSCPCTTALSIEKKTESKRVLESDRLTFLDSGGDKNCNESLSNNLDQKWDYTTKIMMEEFSESWRSVLNCVFPLISVEYSFFFKKTQKRFTTTKNPTMRKYLMKVVVTVNPFSIFISYFQKKVNRISFSKQWLHHLTQLTTKLTGHETSDLYCIVLRNQSLRIHKSISRFEVSSSSFLQDTCPKFRRGLRQPWGTRSVIVFGRKGSTSSFVVIISSYVMFLIP